MGSEALLIGETRNSPALPCSEGAAGLGHEPNAGLRGQVWAFTGVDGAAGLKKENLPFKEYFNRLAYYFFKCSNGKRGITI